MPTTPTFIYSYARYSMPSTPTSIATQDIQCQQPQPHSYARYSMPNGDLSLVKHNNQESQTRSEENICSNGQSPKPCLPIFNCRKTYKRKLGYGPTTCSIMLLSLHCGRVVASYTPPTFEAASAVLISNRIPLLQQSNLRNC